ncbi:MAG: heavy metal translocating P-type ATPase [Ruminococcus sp.]|nr:heavy metal translocating P-type ATPase [Ruminococcus sp.]
MEKYDVTGMSCAACSARVEKAVSSVEGVTSCAVNLLTNSMNVEGSANSEIIIKAVQDAGYGASLHGEKNSENISHDTDTARMKNRLISSVVFLIVLMYISMGHTMWNFPVPGFLDGNCIAIGIAELILSAVVMIINQKFFISGFKSLVHKAPNMDTLVSVGSGASFVWSVIVLFSMTKYQLAGDTEKVMQGMHGFYFESAAMILTLITVGKMLEAHSKGKTADALKSLMKLAPETAVIERDGKEITIPASQIKKDDIFLVRPGDRIPADGIVISGSSAVNESSLTGESIPSEKSAGSEVSAAAVNLTGFMKCRAVRVGEETNFSKIIKLVEDASATKAPIAKIADKVSGVFVPTVIIIALITTAVWLIADKDTGYALARGISVLVISCPCALGLATPVAIMVGNGMGAKNGILFKTAVSLEETGKAQIIALDKTGTITSGEPSVTDIIPYGKYTEEELIKYASSAEKMSEHPLAEAVVKYANENNISTIETGSFKALSGSGIEACCGDIKISGGSLRYISTLTEIPDDIVRKADELSEQGKTPLLFTENNNLMGIIAAADTIKPDSKQAVGELRSMGLKVIMLTGDNEKTARAVGNAAGVDEIAAGVLPHEKENIIRRLKKSGKVIMAGDGINDAPALTRADIGIAIGTGTDVAIDCADVVLMKNNLCDIPSAIRLSRYVMRNIKQNLFWAFIYNIIGIPLAAGLWIPIFGWTLNPMFGAAAMSLSSFCVVTNALRLNLINIHDTKKDKPVKNPVTDININDDRTKRTIKVKGMMCGHCEKRVQDALEKLPAVDNAAADHEKGIVILSLNGEVSDSELKTAVEQQGYKFNA